MNDANELERVYAQQAEKLLAWLEAKAGREEAEDLLQEAFFKACANLDAMEPIRDVAAWLWRCAANGLRDLWRTRKRRGGTVDMDGLEEILPARHGDPAAMAERSAAALALAEALRSLPAAQREAVEGLCLRGESLKAMAGRTGLSIDTLASRKRYGLEKLKEALESYR